MADSWMANSGKGGKVSNLAGAVEASNKNRTTGLESLLKLSQATGTDDQNQTKDLLDAFTKLKSGKDISDAYNRMAQKVNVTHADPAARLNPVMAANGFNHIVEREMTPDRDWALKYQDIVDDLHSGNPAALNNLPLKLAGLQYGGRIAMYEVAKEGGDTSFWQQALAKLERLKSGDITEKNMHEYNDFVADLGKNFAGYHARKFDRLNAMGPAQYYQDPDMMAASMPAEMRNLISVPKKYSDVEMPYPKAGSPGSKLPPAPASAARGPDH